MELCKSLLCRNSRAAETELLLELLTIKLDNNDHSNKSNSNDDENNDNNYNTNDDDNNNDDDNMTM